MLSIDIIRSLSILLGVDKYDIMLIRDTVIHILNDEKVDIFQVYIDESYYESIMYSLEYYKSKNELVYTINDFCIEIKWNNVFIKLYLDYVSVHFSIENVKIYMIDDNNITYEVENSRYHLEKCLYDIETKTLYSKFKYELNDLNEILYKPFKLRTKESFDEWNAIVLHLIKYIRYLKKGFVGEYKCIPEKKELNGGVEIFTQEEIPNENVYLVETKCCGGCYDVEYLLEYLCYFDKPYGGGTINSWELKKCPLCRGKIEIKLNE